MAVILRGQSAHIHLDLGVGSARINWIERAAFATKRVIDRDLVSATAVFVSTL